MTRGLELAITPVVFGGIGWLVDSWLGTRPLFTIGLAVFAVIGTVAKMWFSYDHHMRVIERSGRWSAAARADGPAPAAELPADLWSAREGDAA